MKDGMSLSASDQLPRPGPYLIRSIGFCLHKVRLFLKTDFLPGPTALLSRHSSKPSDGTMHYLHLIVLAFVAMVVAAPTPKKRGIPISYVKDSVF